jgi:hypothetical protein
MLPCRRLQTLEWAAQAELLQQLGYLIEPLRSPHLVTEITIEQQEQRNVVA